LQNKHNTIICSLGKIIFLNMKEFHMVEKKSAWRKEDILATSIASSKNKPDGKAAVAPSSGESGGWSDLRNVADGKEEGVLRPTRTREA